MVRNELCVFMEKNLLFMAWSSSPGLGLCNVNNLAGNLFAKGPAHIPEGGVAGSDPSTRGRSPVVLEVRFRSRALFKAEIQSNIVLGYLHYLDLCTV